MTNCEYSLKADNFQERFATASNLAGVVKSLAERPLAISGHAFLPLYIVPVVFLRTFGWLLSFRHGRCR